MATEPILVVVSREIEDLVPIFLAQRRTDLDVLKSSIPAQDFESIRRVGHGMAGAGASYGFEHLSVLGDRLAMAARASDVDALERLNREFGDYMARLVVKYL